MKDLPYRKKPCKGCPFRKDCTKGWLGRERVTEIVNSDNFLCHKNTDLQCAGHMMLLGDENGFVALARGLNIPLTLNGGELVFDTVEDCVNHHDYENM